MEVNSIILRTTDVDRSAEFWSERVGLPLGGQTPDYAFIDAGPITIVLSAIESVLDESSTEVVLRDGDVRESYRAMSERGVPFETDLRTIWSNDEGEMAGASFRDPDGHYGTLTGWIEST